MRMTNALLVCLMFAAITAQAQVARYELSIPPQSVGEVLAVLAQKTGARFIYADERVIARTSPGVIGHLDVGDAIAEALSGTGLTFHFTASGTVLVSAVPAVEDMGADGPAVEHLPPVTVTATRTERRVDEIPVSVSVIDADQIGLRNVDKVQDLLKDVESVDIGQQFSVAHASGLTIRGVGGSFVGNTTQLMMDGLATDSVISSVMGRGGLNFMSPWDVERVEVVRGPGSAAYGPGVIGGMVNVIPKRWDGGPGIEVHGSYGTHDTRRFGAAAGVGVDRYDLRLSVYDARSDGYVAQTVPAFGSVDLGPRDWRDRKLSLYGGLRPSDAQEWTLSVQNFGTRSALVGGRPNQRQNMDGTAFTLGVRQDIGETVTLKASYRVLDVEQTAVWDQAYYNDIEGDYTKAADWGRFSDSTDLTLQADVRINAANRLLLGYNRGTAEHHARTIPVDGASTDSANEAETEGFFIQDEHRFGALTLLAGGRYDRIRQFDDRVNGVPKVGVPSSTDEIFNPRVGGRYRLSDVTSIYASYGKAYLPAYNSLKYVAPSTTRVDNPDLKPETSQSFEIGANRRTAIGNFRVAVYRTDYTDKIALVANAVDSKSQWQNFGKVRVNGFECGWDGVIGSAWQPYVNYSYTDSRIERDTNPNNVGERLTYTAPHKLNVGVTYVPDERWTVNVAGRYIGEKWLTLPNTDSFNTRLGGYFTADAKVIRALSIGFGRDWQAFVAVNNLTGKRYREWLYYEESDGRTWTIGIDGRF